MKKRSFLIVFLILIVMLGSFLFLGRQRRNEISDIFAAQIEIDEDARADIWINSSDTTYNWVHRSLDFSLGIDTEKTAEASVVFVFSGPDGRTIQTSAAPKTLSSHAETVFPASLPYQKLTRGTWQMSAYLCDENHQKINLKNEGVKDDTLLICTFTVH